MLMIGDADLHDGKQVSHFKKSKTSRILSMQTAILSRYLFFFNKFWNFDAPRVYEKDVKTSKIYLKKRKILRLKTVSNAETRPKTDTNAWDSEAPWAASRK